MFEFVGTGSIFSPAHLYAVRVCLSVRLTATDGGDSDSARGDDDGCDALFYFLFFCSLSALIHSHFMLALSRPFKAFIYRTPS